MSNLFKAFEKLVGKSPLQVGTVVLVNGDICVLELPGGGRIRARGPVEQGKRYFVRDSVIEGEAPSLPLVEFDI